MGFEIGQQLKSLPGPILITGHTGFKGAWLTYLLEYLDIPCVGYSLPPEKDSLFDRAGRLGAIPESFGDIRNSATLDKFINVHRPAAIIHMAAQPLVLQSYKTPKETFDVNVMGTVNVLDLAFAKDFVKAIVIVTTDKVYRNDNSGRAFIESDPLEGKDPYSASKVGTEAVVSAWQQIQRLSGGPKVVSVRAGNVIGGGDWAENRLIPDLIRGFESGSQIEIRNPQSTRPWQHVLDPLFGYLQTMNYVLEKGDLQAVNFGPIEPGLTVGEIVQIAISSWNSKPNLKVAVDRNPSEQESNVLQINPALGIQLFGIRTKWSQKESVIKSIQWWKKYLDDNISPRNLIYDDIQDFLN
jgi:CDP-glucose 4,6-dehydratase